MRRRDLLKAGMAGAAGVATPAFAAGRDPVDQCLQALDLQLRRAYERAGPFLGEIPGFLDEPGLDTALKQTLDGLVRYGALSALSKEEQADPRAQAELLEASRLTGLGVNRLARELDALDDARMEDLSGLLTERPDLVEAVLDSIASETAQIGIPKRARKRLQQTVEETTFDILKGHKAGAVRRQVERFERLHRQVMQADEPRKLLASEPSAETVEVLGRTRGARKMRHPRPPTERELQASQLDDEQAVVLGALLLAIGGGTAAGMVIGTITTSGFALLCICVSIPIITAAILMLVAGASVLARPI